MSTPRSGITHQDRAWSIARVIALGATTDVETAGKIFGIGRTLAYQLAKDDQFPVDLVRVGQLYRVPVPAILAKLGVTTEEAKEVQS